jgi:hypothetical protein
MAGFVFLAPPSKPSTGKHEIPYCFGAAAHPPFYLRRQNSYQRRQTKAKQGKPVQRKRPQLILVKLGAKNLQDVS